MKVNDPVLAPFTADEIAAARKLAASRSASVVAILEEQAGLPPEAFTERLAATLHYPVANIESLHRWQPAFDLLPFAEALRGQVILFRDEQERLRLVFGDPFASDRLAWADERIGAQFIRPCQAVTRDRKSTRLNSSHTEIYTLSLHDALPI